MKLPNPPHHRSISLAQAAAAGLVTLVGAKDALATPVTPMTTDTASPAQSRQAPTGRFNFARDGVLGTSFDLTVHTVRPGEAELVEQAVLAEIDRLSTILSTYDPTSEISRVQLGAEIESPELRELLSAYETWAIRTGGALDARLARVKQLWRDAAQTGHAPDAAALRSALNAPSSLNVDALGKGYIIDRAVAVARRLAPAGLLDIGGDLRAWGDVNWLVGVADPFNPADNAAPLATFVLRDAAVATSGGYARYFNVAGARRSHLIDPRTLQPADGAASATVIAADCLTANALSTAAAVLGGAPGSALAKAQRALGFLLVSASGETHRSGLLATVAAPADPLARPAQPTAAPAASAPSASTPTTGTAATASASAWPKDFQVTINVNIGVTPAAATSTTPAPAQPAARGPGGPGAAGPGVAGPGAAPGFPGAPGGRGGPGGRGFPGGRGPGAQKRAYVAIWIEDAQHKLVRTLTVLGDNPRYVPELTAWYQAIGRADLRNVRSVTRATRANGLYTLTWDGLDNAGQPVAQGAYTLRVEINREHGRHTTSSTALTCDGQPHTFDLAATAESDASKVEYGPKLAPVAP
jgi:thiamine biosynthesis lipoprotein ApbE